jgi:hypothetical protein
MLQMSLDELGLDAQGVAASSGWQVDATSLRASLRKLRAICTHPQVCGNILFVVWGINVARRLDNCKDKVINRRK